MLPNHLAQEISSSDGNIPGRVNVLKTGPDQIFSILILIIFLLLGLSQMFCMIIEFHAVHTCSHLWRLSKLLRLTIIMIF